ncbi:uncharacterized protein EI90DRAFT_3129481 [Cantharellus anzutake]|uniref:uncharacterized protein n=1 Tax=Cantharellus anzutake TaxID=1750568 RepID=UPI0019041DEA|nr:uncharacterized protein EI90DRAFT_3129481 [Cantharellus anzutake]KAF8324749.1 hypothetical protein EI90DRAFT_3129481 [Cantharellus anzutake]
MHRIFPPAYPRTRSNRPLHRLRPQLRQNPIRLLSISDNTSDSDNNLQILTCGQLVPVLKSRVRPYENLALRQLSLAQENAIINCYDLSDLIDGPEIDPDDPHEHEHVYDEYPASILRSPYLATYKPDDSLKGKVARYLGCVISIQSRPPLRAPGTPNSDFQSPTSLPSPSPCQLPRGYPTSGSDTTFGPTPEHSGSDPNLDTFQTKPPVLAPTSDF